MYQEYTEKFFMNDNYVGERKIAPSWISLREASGYPRNTAYLWWQRSYVQKVERQNVEKLLDLVFKGRGSGL
jgi:hypothetical protein